MKPNTAFFKFCTVIVLLALQCTVQADRVVTTDRVKDHVKIHERATSQSGVVGQLRPGASLELISQVPRWREVRQDNGEPGFVSKSWTRTIEDVVERDDNDLRIHYLNVGAGTCTVVECPGQNAPPMIIDCGSLGGTSGDLDEDEATEYMQDILSRHSTRPNLVLSHADRDHYGWISTVLGDTLVDNIWQGGNPSHYTADEFPNWIAHQTANGAVAHGQLDDNFHSDELTPTDPQLNCGLASALILTVNSGSSKNGDSLVLEIRYGDFGATFTGDAEGDTEDNARVNYDENVKTTVLSGSHHGARTHGSNGRRWAEVTAPEVVIFSAGRKFGHPQCDAVARFDTVVDTTRHATQCGDGSNYQAVQRTRQAIYMTEISGTIIVTSSGTSPLTLFCLGTEECSAEVAHQ